MARVTLITARLRIDPPMPADMQGLCDHVTRNRAHARPWSPAHPDAYYTLGWWDGWLARVALDEAREQSLWFLMRLPGDARIVGSIGLTPILRGPFQSAQIGFGLDHDQEGHGLMREGLKAVIAFAFDHLHLHKIVAYHTPDNHRSAATLTALGFVAEGLARNHMEINGIRRDHVMAAVLNVLAE